MRVPRHSSAAFGIESTVLTRQFDFLYWVSQVRVAYVRSRTSLLIREAHLDHKHAALRDLQIRGRILLVS